MFKEIARWHFSLFIFVVGLAAQSNGAAMTITHQVIVQPYQVVYAVEGAADITAVSDGSLELFSDAVFSQVGIDIDILNPIPFNSTPAGDIGDHFDRFPVEVGLPNDFLSIRSRTIVPLFIDSQFPPPGTIGLGWVGAAGILVQSPQFILSNFVHQMGHNLGLAHVDPLQGITSNLMDFGSCRNATLADVLPTVTECDLSLDQISQIRNDLDNLSFAQNINPIPIPAAFWLFGTGLIGLIGFARLKA